MRVKIRGILTLGIMIASVSQPLAAHPGCRGVGYQTRLPWYEMAASKSAALELKQYEWALETIRLEGWAVVRGLRNDTIEGMIESLGAHSSGSRKKLIEPLGLSKLSSKMWNAGRRVLISTDRYVSLRKRTKANIEHPSDYEFGVIAAKEVAKTFGRIGDRVYEVIAEKMSSSDSLELEAISPGELRTSIQNILQQTEEWQQRIAVFRDIHLILLARLIDGYEALTETRDQSLRMQYDHFIAQTGTEEFKNRTAHDRTDELNLGNLASFEQWWVDMGHL